jgi:hypothetical protein
MEKEALEFIQDTFVGADGGIRFVHLKLFIENLSKQADEGDYQAGQVLDKTIHTFRRFIELAESYADKKP